MISSEIKYAKYNKISCSKCGEKFTADLVAFDFGKVFADIIIGSSTKIKERWLPLVNLDLKFYYTLRDLSQENKLKMTLSASPTSFKLTVKDVKRQVEFLLGDVPFSSITDATENSLYNNLYKSITSKLEVPEETLSEIVKLVRTLKENPDNLVIMTVPIKIFLDNDINGNEIPSCLKYYVNGAWNNIPLHRVCPFCGMAVDWLGGYRQEIIIGLVGLSGVGKTSYIASLISRLKEADSEHFISIKKNLSESLAAFDSTIVSEYEKGNMVQKTDIENVNSNQLIYLPLCVGNKEYNLVFVDIPGEIYSGVGSEGLDYISNKRPIFKNADMIWCFVEPAMIDNCYHNMQAESKEKDTNRQLQGMLNVLNVVYGEKKPTCIILTQSDLVDKVNPGYGLYRPEVNVIEEYLLNDNSLDIVKTNDFGEETKAFIDQMNNFELSMEDAVEGFEMFSVSSYGFDASSPVVLSDQKLNPSMIELPLLWTLARFGIIRATKLVVGKNSMFGNEKVYSNTVENIKEFYLKY